MWEKVTVISGVEAVHVALVPSHARNGLDFQLGDQSRSPCSDLGAADTGWCRCFDLSSSGLRAGARCGMRAPARSWVCSSENVALRDHV